MTQSPNLEILIAAMHQRDLSLYEKMNIHGADVVIANQTEERPGLMEEERGADHLRMITTPGRGVGKNRNLALDAAEGEILLFADADVIYEDGAADMVRNAFRNLPEADVIIFGLQFEKNGRIERVQDPPTGRLPVYRAMRYGACQIAVRRESVRRHGLRFTELFGGGCLYSHGEDTDFLLQCYRKKLKICTWHGILGKTMMDTSTCFSGYHEKYFFDKGAFARNSFGWFAPCYMLYMATKKVSPCSLSFWQKMKLMRQGYRWFPERCSYEMWVKKV